MPEGYEIIGTRKVEDEVIGTRSDVDLATLPDDAMPEEVRYEADRMRNAYYYARNLGVPIDEAFNNEPQLNEVLYGPGTSSQAAWSETRRRILTGRRKTVTQAAKDAYTNMNQQFAKAVTGLGRQLAEVKGIQYSLVDPAFRWLFGLSEDVHIDKMLIDMADAATADIEESRREHPEMGYAIDPDAGYAEALWQTVTRPENMVQGLIEAGPMVLEGVLGTTAAGPAGGIAAMGLPISGDVYQSARSEGTGITPAFAQAVLTGGLEAAIEQWTLGKKIALGKNFRQMLEKSGTRKVMWEGTKAFFRGSAEEGTQQMNENFWRWVFTDRSQKWFAGVQQATAMGGPLELAMSGGFATAGAVGSPVEVKEAERRLDILKRTVRQAPNLTDESKQEILETLEKVPQIVPDVFGIEVEGEGKEEAAPVQAKAEPVPEKAPAAPVPAAAAEVAEEEVKIQPSKEWIAIRDAMPWDAMKSYGHRLELDGSITLKTMRAGGPGDVSRGGVWYEVALRGDESLSSYGGVPGKTGSWAAPPTGVGGLEVTRGEVTLRQPYVFDVTKIPNEARQVIRLAEKLFGKEQVKKWSRGITGVNAEKAFARIEKKVSELLVAQGYDSVLFYHDIAGQKYPDNIFKLPEPPAKPDAGTIPVRPAPGVAGKEAAPVQAVPPAVSKRPQIPTSTDVSTQVAEGQWGSANTGVTRDEYEAIKAKRAKGGKLKGGRAAGGTVLFDPEEWSDMLKIGRFHLEAGARAFADWAKRMAEDFGDAIQPHLDRLWQEIGGTAEPSGGVAWHTPLRIYLEQSKELRPEVEEEAAAKRSSKAGSYKAILEYYRSKGITGEEALRRARAALAGPQAEYQRFEPLDKYMTPEQIQGAYADIADREMRPYQRVLLERAFNHLREGLVLPPHEIKALQKWRPELAEILKKRAKKQPITVRIASQVEQILGLLKFSASFDVQMRRQARWLRARHPKLYLAAIGKNINAYISKRYADKMAAEVRKDRQYKTAKAHGVIFLQREGKLSKDRPEQYISYYGEKIPIIGRGYAASMRGFVDSFNWLQLQLWKHKIAQWKKQGKKITSEDLDDLAEFNNTFLGVQPAKTNFGRAARRVLAPVMWSPTLTWSRIRSPEMILTNKAMRGETALTLASYISSGIMFMLAASALARMLGKDDPVEWNPTSSDFGKIRVSDTRVDVYGDGGPFIRALIQFIWQTKTNQAGRVRHDVGIEPIKQFLRNKRAPFLDLLSKVWTGRNYYGGEAWQLPDWVEMKEEGGIKQIIAKAGEKITEPKVGEIGYFITRDLLVSPFVPFFIQGTIEASWNDGWPIALWAGGEELFSGSVLSYKPSDYTRMQLLQDQTASARHGKLWDELSPSQQSELRHDVPEIDDLEEKAAYERLPAEEIKLTEQNETAKRITKSLPKSVQSELDAAQVRVTGLSRKLGDYWLNDRRYEAYETLATAQIQENLGKVLARRSWPGKSDETKTELLKAVIKEAKEEARKKLLRQIERGDL